jgi:lysophospholipase L1-like esterase
MERYTDTILNKQGKPVAGAVVTVTAYPGNAPAIIYATDGGAAVPSVVSDENGCFSFYAADGHYCLNITGKGIGPLVVADVVLNDPSNDVTLLSLAADDGTTKVSHNGRTVADVLNELLGAVADVGSTSAGDQLMAYISARMAAGDAVKIACYGDSTTDGNNTTGWSANPTTGGGSALGTSDHESTAPNAWPAKLKALLQDMFSNPNIAVWNAGYSGRSLNDGWALENYDRAITDNPAYGRADLCFIGFGLNDISNTFSYVEHADQTRLLIKKLLAAGTIPVLLTCDAAYRNEAAIRDHKEASRQIDQAKRSIAAAYRIPIIDIAADLKDWLNKNSDGYRWGTEQNDGLHFGDNGHAFKACAIAKALFRDVFVVEQGQWTRLCSMDSRSSYLDVYTKMTSSGLTAQGRSATSTTDNVTGSAAMTLWVWNTSPSTELIYRGIGNEGYQSAIGGVRPSVRVAEMIQRKSITRIPGAVGFTSESTSSYRKSDLPYRVTHLPYGLSKIQYLKGDNASSAMYGNFEFWQTPRNAGSCNALQRVGYFQVDFVTDLTQVALLPEFLDGSNAYGLMDADSVTILADITLPVGTGFILSSSQTFAAGAKFGDKVFSFLYRAGDGTLQLHIGQLLSGVATFGGTIATSSPITWSTNRAKIKIVITRSGDTQTVTLYGGYPVSGASIMTYSLAYNGGAIAQPFAGFVGGLTATGSISGAVTAAIHELVVLRSPVPALA